MLAKEGRDDLRCARTFGSLEREVVPSDDRSVAHSEELNDRIALGQRRGENVEIIALVRVHLLPIEGAIDRGEAIA